MAKPNYSFEKRKRELAKQKKKEEKRQRKIDKKNRVDRDTGNLPVQEEE